MYNDIDTKWGRRAALVVALIGAFTTIIVFGGLMMSGGGCEGRPQPCSGAWGSVWSIMLLMIATFIGAGFMARSLANSIARAIRRRHNNRLSE